MLTKIQSQFLLYDDKNSYDLYAQKFVFSININPRKRKWE